MNEFYSPASASDRSTLYNIRDKFGHRNVGTKVSACVNHVMDLLRMTTESMACLCGMHVLGMSKREDIPQGCPSPEDSLSERSQFVCNTAKAVVDCIWPDIDHANISAVSTDPDEEDGSFEGSFCTCDGSDIEGIHAQYDRGLFTNLVVLYGQSNLCLCLFNVSVIIRSYIPFPLRLARNVLIDGH